MNLTSIKYNPNCDTRTMTELKSREEVLNQNLSHILEVKSVSRAFVQSLDEQIGRHDLDKLFEIDQYYKDMKESWEKGSGFTTLPWYQKHKEERHHRVDNDELFRNSDVKLEDILENAIDKLTAQAARKGQMSVKEIMDSYDPQVIWVALANTLESLKEDIWIIKG